MIIAAYYLFSHDVFTKDGGATWHTVKVHREADRGRKQVVIDTDGKEHIFASEDQVTIKD